MLKTLSDEKDKQNTQLKPVAISDFNFASTNDTNAVDHDGATKDQTFVYPLVVILMVLNRLNINYEQFIKYVIKYYVNNSQSNIN